MNDLYPRFRFTFSPDVETRGLFVLEGEIVIYQEGGDDDATIFEGEDAEKEFLQIGTLSALYAPLAGSLNLFDAADAHSGTAASQAWALTQSTYEGHFGFQGVTESAHSWLGVEMMVVDPRFRRRGLSYQFLDQLRVLLGPAAVITVMADPTYEEETTKADIAAATAKLKLHWLRFGFRQIDDTGVYYINTAHPSRPNTWLQEKQDTDEPNEAADEFDEGLFEGHAHQMPDGEDFFNGDF
mgnify:CR=1 FL=1